MTNRRTVLAAVLAALLLASLQGCAIEASPSVPGAPERRAVVVPAQRAPGPDGPDASEPSCDASCPTPRADEELDGCYPVHLDGRVVHHRLALGERPTAWVVCAFEAR